MVLCWGRIKPSNLRCLSHQIARRSYFRVAGSRSSANCTLLSPLVHAPAKPDLFLPKAPPEFACPSRGLKFKKKTQPKIKEERKSRTNDEITAEEVRIIRQEDGFTENRVVSISEALELARQLDLDLVEVQPSGKPPVCRFMDFHKEKYKKQAWEKERAKSKSKQFTLRDGDFKIVRFKEKIDKHDLKNKANMAKRLIEQGYRVKFLVERPKLTKEEEREDEEVKKNLEGIKAKELKKLLADAIEVINDVIYVEGAVVVEKSQAYIVVRHRMLAPANKSVKKDSVSSPGMSTSSSTRSKSKKEDEISSTENRNAWTISEANDEFDQVFDFGNDGQDTPSSCDKEKGGAAKAPLSSTTNGVSDILQPKPVLDSRQARTLPSDVTENRYKRSEPNTQRTGTDSAMSRNSRAPIGTPGQSPDPRQARALPSDAIENRYKRSDPNTQRTGTDSGMFRNSRAPIGTPGQSPQRPSHPGMPRTATDSAIYRNSKAPNEIPRPSLQQPSHHPSGARAPVSSYSSFSAKKPDATGRQDMAVEGNKSQGGYSKTRNK